MGKLMFGIIIIIAILVYIFLLYKGFDLPGSSIVNSILGEDIINKIGSNIEKIETINVEQLETESVQNESVNIQIPNELTDEQKILLQTTELDQDISNIINELQIDVNVDLPEFSHNN